jgi:hypothetical protein
MKRLVLLVVILLLLLTACSSAVATNVQMKNGCMTWRTTQDARCRVTYCYDNLCTSTEWEANFKVNHCQELPIGSHNIKILSLDRFNRMSENEVANDK